MRIIGKDMCTLFLGISDFTHERFENYRDIKIDLGKSRTQVRLFIMVLKIYVGLIKLNDYKLFVIY